MIYINDNTKLADLLEKMLKPEKMTEADLSDARDLIADLRSPRGQVSLGEDCSNTHHD